MIEMYLEFEGVKGRHTHKTAKDAMEILAWSWGVSGTPDSRPNIQDLSITMWMDETSPQLVRSLKEHKAKPARLLCYRPRDEEHPLYLYEMEGAQVTSVSMGGSGGEDRFTLNVSVTFRKVTMKVSLIDEEGCTTAEYSSVEMEQHQYRR